MTRTTTPTISPHISGHTQVFWDVALRDFGLMIGAIALARLAAVFAPALPFEGRSR